MDENERKGKKREAQTPGNSSSDEEIQKDAPPASTNAKNTPLEKETPPQMSQDLMNPSPHVKFATTQDPVIQNQWSNGPPKQNVLADNASKAWVMKSYPECSIKVVQGYRMSFEEILLPREFLTATSKAVKEIVPAFPGTWTYDMSASPISRVTKDFRHWDQELTLNSAGLRDDEAHIFANLVSQQWVENTPAFAVMKLLKTQPHLQN